MNEASYLPEPFLQSLDGLPGFHREAFREAHESRRQLTSVRLNPQKSPGKLSFTDTKKVPWCRDGLYLAERPSFTLDPLFHAGVYYVQEASSMFLEQAFSQHADAGSGLRVLDLCASPGGKSTHLLSMLGPEDLLVSNEVIRSRLNVLAENLSKWGHANVVAVSADPKEIGALQGFFDVMVVDAPCSGSGLFRRDPDAVNEWSPEAVNLCSQRQQRILSDALEALKPGGLLIYSTCSYAREEDEDIAGWLIDEWSFQSLQINIDPSWGIVQSTARPAVYGYRFYPDQVEGEGFYMSVFRKPDGPVASLKNNSRVLQPLPVNESKVLSGYLSMPAGYNAWLYKDDVLFFPSQHVPALSVLQQKLYIRKAGVLAGTFMKKDFVPHHELAMSVNLSEAETRVELTYEDALNYLRRAPMPEMELNRGWILVSYQKVPLGWIKAVPGRINNYYPKDWRILNK